MHSSVSGRALALCRVGSGCALLLGYLVQGAAAVENGGFESGLEGWRPLWTREAGQGLALLDRDNARGGDVSLRIQHRGMEDWSLEPERDVVVDQGQILEWSGWVEVAGSGRVVLCVSTWDAAGKVVDWSFAARSPRVQDGWQPVTSRFVVPTGVVRIRPRLIGYGPAELRVDDFSLSPKGRVALAGAGADRPPLKLGSDALAVEIDRATGGLKVTDAESGRVWVQRSIDGGILVRGADLTPDRVRLELVHAAQGLEFTATISVAGREVLVVLEGEGPLESALRYPHPFEGRPGEYLVIPMNEGISYPVEDGSVSLHRLIAYGGHGICMAFFGATDGACGWMGILETADDAAIRMGRTEGRLWVAPEWDSQRGQFGYARQLRYVFLAQGGHVAMAKRYRAYAGQVGRLRTLEEKRRGNPNVDLLAGAVNIWCWDRNAVPLVQEIQAAGIDRILWSNRQGPTNLAALNALGVLTSRYDIYQDVMDPARFPELRWVHPDWTTAAWPDDLIVDARGQFLKGWGVEAKDGGMIDCGVLCDRRALRYARERIPAELATHPYRSRFIDTTTAAPWNECYSSQHPMTRTQSREAKMELLRYVSAGQGLVTGCETGHDAAVPFLHYFEGMLSLGPYRVPDAGRRMQVIWTEVPEVVAKFQLGQAYRLPLWELVYHDCVVAQWYWGDYNNKLPALWDKRDLFNALYGTPPMFMFDRKLWEQNRERFVRSYRSTCPLVRRVAYAEMTDHRFLTADRNVQQTAFANGVTVTANFGSEPFRMADGRVVAAMGLDVRP